MHSKKDKVKRLLDIIPLIILTVSATRLIWYIQTGQSEFHWKHIVGLIILPVNYLLFIRYHKLGILGLGFTLLMGVFGLISYDQAISTTTFYIGSEKESWIPIFMDSLFFFFGF